MKAKHELSLVRRVLILAGMAFIGILMTFIVGRYAQNQIVRMQEFESIFYQVVISEPLIKSGIREYIVTQNADTYSSVNGYFDSVIKDLEELKTYGLMPEAQIDELLLLNQQIYKKHQELNSAIQERGSYSNQQGVAARELEAEKDLDRLNELHAARRLGTSAILAKIQLQNAGARYSLRKEEKDYNEIVRIGNELKRLVGMDPATNSALESEITTAVDEYVQVFRQAFDLDSRIGIIGNEGLWGEIRSIAAVYEGKLDSFNEETLAVIDRINDRNSILGIVLSAFVLVVILGFASLSVLSFVKRVRNVTVRMRAMMDFAQFSVEERRSFRTKDELRIIDRALKAFIDKLNSGFNDIKQVINQGRVGSRAIKFNTEGVRASLSSISERVGEMVKETSILNERISKANDTNQEIQTTVEKFNQRITEQNQTINTTASSMEEVSNSIGNMAVIVGERQRGAEGLLHTTREGGQQIKATNEVIEDIAHRIDDMLEMITVINKISSQTNLLAMNAAIEAAHAGEAGVGFAVVADEIRRLAENTGENASRISNTLQQMVENISRASDLSENSSLAINKINEEVETFVGALTEISKGTNEVAANSRGISKSVKSLLTISAEIQEGSKSIKENTREAADSLGTVKEIFTNSALGVRRINWDILELDMIQQQNLHLSDINNNDSISLLEKIESFKTGEDGSAHGKTIIQVVVDFQQWRKKLREYMLSRIDVPPDHIDNYNKCDIGVWISEPQNDIFRKTPAYEDFYNAHVAYHELAAEAIEVRELFKSDNIAYKSEFEDVLNRERTDSHRLIEAIIGLYDSVRSKKPKKAVNKVEDKTFEQAESQTEETVSDDRQDLRNLE